MAQVQSQDIEGAQAIVIVWLVPLDSQLAVGRTIWTASLSYVELTGHPRPARAIPNAPRLLTGGEYALRFSASKAALGAVSREGSSWAYSSPLSSLHCLGCGWRGQAMRRYKPYY